jgi:hypothetical protein
VDPIPDPLLGKSVEAAVTVLSFLHMVYCAWLCFMPVLLFDPEARGNIFLQNIDFNWTVLIG